ncbi:MAG: hypothetical protein PHY31_09685, partial [Smithellaceae bacterium]|nr:hypothetical protein [Smithellaceae bacterium]
MKIGVSKEVLPGERRVALTPDICARLKKAGLEIIVEAGAGGEAFFSDDDYRQAGAEIVSTQVLFSTSDILVKINGPRDNPGLAGNEAMVLREGAALVSLLDAGDETLLDLFAARQITVFSVNTLPRISRAQTMDALSSQATVAGYKAALIAASSLPRYFPLLITAAGTFPPAKVLVLGAGVAGLQAIATSTRLGALA